MNQYQLESLFETDSTSINRHIRNIYKSKELDENSTCAKIAQVQEEVGRTIKRHIKYYNLDLIIAAGEGEAIIKVCAGSVYTEITVNVSLF